MSERPEPPLQDIHLFVPLICYNQTAQTKWMMCMMRLLAEGSKRGIRFAIELFDSDSLVNRARNAAAALFLREPTATHMLFVDSDVQFDANDVIRMIEQNVDVICAGYPTKALDLDMCMEGYRAKLADPLAVATSIPLHLEKGAEPNERGLLEVEMATTGFLLVKRSVVERMAEHYTDHAYTNDVDLYARPGHSNQFCNLFPVSVDPVSNRLLSEDYGFSMLWRALGGKIYALPDVTLAHWGWFAYRGNVSQQLDFNETLGLGRTLHSLGPSSGRGMQTMEREPRPEEIAQPESRTEIQVAPSQTPVVELSGSAQTPVARMSTLPSSCVDDADKLPVPHEEQRVDEHGDTRGTQDELAVESQDLKQRKRVTFV